MRSGFLTLAFGLSTAAAWLSVQSTRHALESPPDAPRQALSESRYDTADYSPKPPSGLVANIPGQSNRRKSLDPGSVSITARILCGEVARQSEPEIRAVIGVIFNRLARARVKSPDATLIDVVLHSNGSTFAFTAADPTRANGDLVWNVQPRCHSRMVRLINDQWQRGAGHSFTHYWHPDAMTPRGAVPRWAIDKPATRIGAALFIE